ncbi:hypothetical protein MTP99_011206 [Tenebrio molitor]|nr:hypothetical protein MTP99_011206 [Tenebrio molitor]
MANYLENSNDDIFEDDFDILKIILSISILLMNKVFIRDSELIEDEIEHRTSYRFHMMPQFLTVVVCKQGLMLDIFPIVYC